MKKGLATILVAIMLLMPTQAITNADDSLDIEQVAIAAVKNSQAMQSVERSIKVAERNYNKVQISVSGLDAIWNFAGSYSLLQTKILAPMQMKNILDRTVYTQRVVNNAVRLSAYKEYINLLKEKFALDTQIRLMNQAEGDYKKLQIQNNLGILNDYQLRQAEIIYRQNQLIADSAQKKYGSASMTVNRLMGEDLAKELSNLQASNILPATEVRSLDDYVNQALGSRAEILNSRNALETKTKQFEFGKATFRTNRDYYIQEQQDAIDNAQNTYDLAKINVQQDIISLYQGLEFAQNNLLSAKDLSLQAEQNLQAAEIRFNNGQISLMELNTERIAKAKADINLKNAELDAWLMQMTLDMASDVGFKPN